MSDAFLDDESSVEDGQPRELYEIVQNSVTTYRIASGDRDVVYAGHTFEASPVARSEVGIDSGSATLEVQVTLPLRHPLCQRYLALATPPALITATIFRKQLRSGLVERQWQGPITSMSANFAEQVAQFRIPSRMSLSLGRKVSSITCGALCGNILWDGVCQVPRSTYAVSTTVVSVDGRRVKVASVAPYTSVLEIDRQMFVFGELLHVATGEPQTVIAQTDYVIIDMEGPIAELKVGDVVELRGGCAHDIDTCFAKFANKDNFSGQPALPKVDLWIPGNRVGVYGTT